MTVFPNMDKDDLKQAFLAGKATKISDDVGMTELERQTGEREFRVWYDRDYKQE